MLQTPPFVEGPADGQGPIAAHQPSGFLCFPEGQQLPPILILPTYSCCPYCSCRQQTTSMLQMPLDVEGPAGTQGSSARPLSKPVSCACLKVSRRASFWRELRPRSTAIDSTVLARAVLPTSSKRAPETSPGAAALGVLHEAAAHVIWCTFWPECLGWCCYQAPCESPSPPWGCSAGRPAGGGGACDRVHDLPCFFGVVLLLSLM